MRMMHNKSKIKVLFYISTHGFGHATRIMEVINALRTQPADMEIFIKSDVPEWLFHYTLKNNYQLYPMPQDFGVLQTDYSEVDILASLQQMRKFAQDAENILHAEVTFCNQHDITVIVSDIPPLAFKIGHESGIPAIGISNFSWDWIYKEYMKVYPDYQDVIDFMQFCYRLADNFLRLPLHGDVSIFPRITEIPLIGRRSRKKREYVRSRLQIAGNEQLVLITFGGSRSIKILTENVNTQPAIKYFVTETSGIQAERMQILRTDWLQREQLEFEDIILASDAVMSKPGYGICSECLVNGPPLIYTERKNFCEYDVLVEGMQRLNRAVFLSAENLSNGEWGGAIDEALELGYRDCPIAFNGADEAALEIINMAGKT